MTALASLLIVAVAVYAILRRAEVRLTLLLAALALGVLAGQPAVIVRTFLAMLTREQYLVPIGCSMGLAYVLRHTGCDAHLVHLLVGPLRRVRPLLVPGVVLVGVLVNVPIISQTSTAVAVGMVLVPLLRAARRVSAVTTGAALLLGSSLGGELLNPGAPELRTVSTALETPSAACVGHIFPLLLIQLAVATGLFWALSLRAEAHDHRGVETPAGSDLLPGSPADQPREGGIAVKPAGGVLASPHPAGPADGPLPPDPFRVNVFKALVPLVPLALLFLTALPPRFRALDVPQAWLVDAGSAGPKAPATDVQASFDSRLIGAAMLVGVVAAALTVLREPRRLAGTAAAFFEGVGYACAHIISLIVVAVCFGKGVELSGLAAHLGRAVTAFGGLLLPTAGALALGFAWVCGSGMASTQSLFGFFVGPARDLGQEPLRVGAVVSLAAAAGRTLSPVAAVTLMCASLTGTSPLDLVRRLALPLLAGTAAVVLAAAVLGAVG